LLSALGLAVLAMLALGASTAQAHEWTFKGTPLSKLGGKTSITGKSAEPIYFNWSSVDPNFTWGCGSVTESGTAETGGVSQATLQFSGCGFVGFFAGRCNISQVGKTTVSTKVVEVTVEGKPKTYEVYTTLAGKPLEFQIQGPECILGTQTWPFSGSFASQIDGVERASQPKTFSKANQVQGGFLFHGGSAPLYIEGGWSETLGIEGNWLLS
jgi:hypothetical protein